MGSDCYCIFPIYGVVKWVVSYFTLSRRLIDILLNHIIMVAWCAVSPEERWPPGWGWSVERRHVPGTFLSSPGSLVIILLVFYFKPYNGILFFFFTVEVLEISHYREKGPGLDQILSFEAHVSSDVWWERKFTKCPNWV